MCVCQGLEGVVMELMLWVKGLLGLQPCPSIISQLWAGQTHLLGRWTLAFEHPTLCYVHTEKVLQHPSGPAPPPWSHLGRASAP